MTINAYRTCEVCSYYASRRGEVLAAELALQAFKRGVKVTVVVHEYLSRVHDRHLAGGSLSTRIHTPTIETKTGSRIYLKRSCNGCGETVGDVNEAELDAAMSGAPLPDVRLECGCYGREASAA